MTLLHTSRWLFIPILLGLAACSEPEDTRPGKPVAHRRAAFHDLLKVSEPLGKALKEQRFQADKVATLAKQLNALKETPWPYFVPDSLYPPSRATDKVWAEADKFAALRESFLKTAQQLDEAAAVRDEPRVRAVFAALQDACRDCHRSFRK